jgi:hypothetical protein
MDKKISELTAYETSENDDLLPIVDVIAGETKKQTKEDFLKEIITANIPVGLIAMWSGNIASIPSGWVLCDGNNSTPDLRDRFIVGARADYDYLAMTNVRGEYEQTGGDASAQFEVPGTESDTGYADVTDDGHTHTISATPEGNQDSLSFNLSEEETDTGYAQVSDGGHTHNFGPVDTELESICPPFYALAFIMKT